MQEETPVSDIMTTPVVTVDGDATVVEAAHVLSERHIGSLVVGSDVVEGIVTESDVVRVVGQEGDPEALTVADVKSDPVVTARPTESVRTAARRMAQNSVKKLPVTERGSAVGIVTTTDLARFVPHDQ